MMAALVGLAALDAAPQAANDGATVAMPQFSVESDLVMVAVTAIDGYGKAIEGLSAGDFAISEDGGPQAIRVFEFRKLSADEGASYYLLGYYAGGSADGGFRRIGVSCRHARLNFRPGYRMRLPDDDGGDQRLKPGTTAPVLLHKQEPEYPEEARRAKYSGTVVLEAEIDDSGGVRDVRVRSLGLGLDEKAVEAVAQWRFQPGTRDGQPVAMRARVRVSFRLL